MYKTGDVVTINYDNRGTNFYKAKFLNLEDYGELGKFAHVELLEDVNFWDQVYDLPIQMDKGDYILEQIETVQQDSLSFFRSKMQ